MRCPAWPLAEVPFEFTVHPSARARRNDRAFSSEVETGSRKENASIKNPEPRFDSIEAEKLSFPTMTGHA
jgi:hypothetical protein